MSEENKKKLAMVVFSGDMDKLFAAFSIATGAAASVLQRRRRRPGVRALSRRWADSLDGGRAGDTRAARPVPGVGTA